MSPTLPSLLFAPNPGRMPLFVTRISPISPASPTAAINGDYRTAGVRFVQKIIHIFDLLGGDRLFQRSVDEQIAIFLFQEHRAADRTEAVPDRQIGPDAKDDGALLRLYKPAERKNQSRCCHLIVNVEAVFHNADAPSVFCIGSIATFSGSYTAARIFE